VALCAACCALVGCRGSGDGGAAEADGAAGKATAMGSAIVPTGSSASLDAGGPTATSGPCAGRASGAFACDGARVLRCSTSAPEEVRSCLDIERCNAQSGACDPACPEGEVYIPPTGPEGFRMGTGATRFGFGSRKSGDTGHGLADAPHTVVLTRPFCIDATEVTVAAMIECVRDRGCPAPSVLDRWATYPKKPTYPVNMADWTKAKAFCDKNGKSLPTEAQWEWAASGGDGRKWPWGDEAPTCARADYTAASLETPGGDSGCHGGGPSPVGAHPDGDRILPTGRIHDLAGNVWEWCLDNYEPYPTSKQVDPLVLRGAGGNHVVRGGGWNRSHKGITTWFRGAAIVTYQVPGLGFRCVRNPK
jgi:formylglycine-generating enzyme required for sulfatase activity